MLLTKKMILLVLGVSVAGVVLSSQDAEKYRALRDNRQAIYREFGFNSPIDVLEEMCSLFARDPKNSGFWRKINAEIENRKLLFARYVDALLACVKAGDLEWPEEFSWTNSWSMTNCIIEQGLEILQNEMVANIANAKDPANVAKKVKDIFEEVLRDRVARLIGKKLIARCATQSGTGLKLYVAGVSSGSQDPKKGWVLRDEQQIICRVYSPASQLAASERIPVLRNERQGFYRKFCFDSKVNVLKEACELFAIDPKNVGLLNTINDEIRKRKGLFIRYTYVLINSVKAGDLEQPEEFFWTSNWDDINYWIGSSLYELQKKMVADIANAIDPTATVYKAGINFKKDLIDVVAQVIGQKIIARCAEQIKG